MESKAVFFVASPGGNNQHQTKKRQQKHGLQGDVEGSARWCWTMLQTWT